MKTILFTLTILILSSISYAAGSLSEDDEAGTKFITKFITTFRMDETNTRILLKTFERQYGIPRGTSLSRIQQAYLHHFFAQPDSKRASVDVQVPILLKKYQQIFGSQASGAELDLIEKKYLHAFLTNQTIMDETNCKMVLQKFVNSFGNPPFGESFMSVKRAYVNYFTSKFDMTNHTNTIRLIKQFNDLFGCETAPSVSTNSIYETERG